MRPPIRSSTGRIHFAPDAPLLRHGLLRLSSDPPQPQHSLLPQMLRLDDQVVRLLLGQSTLDPRLERFCSLTWVSPVPGALPLASEQMQTLESLVVQAWDSHDSLRLYLQGPAGAGQAQTAPTLAAAVGAPPLCADLARLGSEGFRSHLRLVLREAWFQDAVQYIGETEKNLNRIFTAAGNANAILLFDEADLRWRNGRLGTSLVPDIDVCGWFGE